MKDNTWAAEKMVYAMPEGYSLKKAAWQEYADYFAVYVVYYQNVWFRQSYERFCAIVEECDCCYWIEKDGKRIGGVLMEPNYINCLFLIPPHNELDKVLSYLKELLLIWSDKSKDIAAGSIKPDQVRIFQRHGFRELETRRCMIRPTEKFNITWDSGLIVKKPALDHVEELSQMFHSAFQGGPGADGNMSVEELRDHMKYYLEGFCQDKVLQEASTLLYDKNSDALIGACLISLWEGWPNFFLLGLTPSYKNRGLGTKLMKHALSALHDHYPVARLFVTLGNEAELLYHKLGFMSGIETTKMFIPAQEK